jgi:hypothetical protein
MHYSMDSMLSREDQHRVEKVSVVSEENGRFGRHGAWCYSVPIRAVKWEGISMGLTSHPLLQLI